MPPRKNKLKHNIDKITSIGDLRYKCTDEYPDHELYRKLATISGRNLGGSTENVQQAIRWLETNAMETTEEGVVDEINFCRDLVK